MTLHIEVERLPERVFARFFFRRLSSGVLMFFPDDWEAFIGVLRQTFQVEMDIVSPFDTRFAEEKGQEEECKTSLTPSTTQTTTETPQEEASQEQDCL